MYPLKYLHLFLDLFVKLDNIVIEKYNELDDKFYEEIING